MRDKAFFSKRKIHLQQVVSTLFQINSPDYGFGIGKIPGRVKVVMVGCRGRSKATISTIQTCFRLYRHTGFGVIVGHADSNGEVERFSWNEPARSPLKTDDAVADAY